MAQLRRRGGRHEVLAARPDSRRQRAGSPRRLALALRRPRVDRRRSGPAVQSDAAGHAADGWGTAPDEHQPGSGGGHRPASGETTWVYRAPPRTGYVMARSRNPEFVEHADLIRFEQDGRSLDPDRGRPYGERMIHGAIYEARGDVDAVVHDHAYPLLPFGITRRQHLRAHARARRSGRGGLARAWEYFCVPRGSAAAATPPAPAAGWRGGPPSP